MGENLNHSNALLLLDVQLARLVTLYISAPTEIICLPIQPSLLPTGLRRKVENKKLTQ